MFNIGQDTFSMYSKALSQEAFPLSEMLKLKQFCTLILKQLNDFYGILSHVFVHLHLFKLLEATLDLSKLIEELHLDTN